MPGCSASRPDGKRLVCRIAGVLDRQASTERLEQGITLQEVARDLLVSPQASTERLEHAAMRLKETSAPSERAVSSAI